ncbi:MAG: RNA-binding protein [Chloroflexota bacterium]|nr:RNA-binding protein [Chloroflexota bacterium]
MAKKLYVGNLPYSVTEDQLREMFSELGELSDVAVVTDRYTGQSKGFGFVEMVSDEAAQAAITKFDGQDMNGRAMVVNEAKPREDRGGGGGRSYGGGGGGGGRGGGGYGGGGGRGGRGGDGDGGGGGGRGRY